MALAVIDGVYYSTNYISILFFNYQYPLNPRFWIRITLTITYPIIMGLLIRFERVQVQLRAQEENTIKILEAIKRANIL